MPRSAKERDEVARAEQRDHHRACSGDHDGDHPSASRISRATARSSNSSDLVADGLGRFVTLAGNQNDVPGLRPAYGDLYGPTAIWFNHNAATVVGGDPLHRGIDDLERVLGTWVVGGDHNIVGQPRGHGTHQRALLPIAVTAAAEHHVNGRITRSLPGGTDRFFQSIRGVRVVDDDGKRLSGRDGLETTGHGARVVQPARDRRWLETQPRTRRRRGKAVHHIELATDRDIDRLAAPCVAVARGRDDDVVDVTEAEAFGGDRRRHPSTVARADRRC